ncbi:MAG TPA: hypothetical protein VJ742_12560 [Nitrososphaera sp.]|nr:hypothetical protein [Nitrososphaera sp.]
MDQSQLRTDLRKAGYRVDITKGGHLAVIDTIDGQLMGIMAQTPSDHRAVANSAAQLRRAGVDLHRRPKREERKAKVIDQQLLSDRTTQVINLAMHLGVVTPQILQDRLSIGRSNAYQLVSSLTAKGILTRVRPGTYEYSWTHHHDSAEADVTTADVVQHIDRAIKENTTSVSALYEFVAADPNGGAILRAEDQGLWLAVPLRQAFEALGKDHG